MEPRDDRDEDREEGFEDALDAEEDLALADRAGLAVLDFAFAEGLAIGDTVGFVILVDGHRRAPLPHVDTAYFSTGERQVENHDAIFSTRRELRRIVREMSYREHLNRRRVVNNYQAMAADSCFTADKRSPRQQVLQRNCSSDGLLVRRCH